MRRCPTFGHRLTRYRPCLIRRAGRSALDLRRWLAPPLESGIFDTSIFILDWLGIIAFTITGELAASRSQMDVGLDAAAIPSEAAPTDGRRVKLIVL